MKVAAVHGNITANRALPDQIAYLEPFSSLIAVIGGGAVWLQVFPSGLCGPPHSFSHIFGRECCKYSSFRQHPPPLFSILLLLLLLASSSTSTFSQGALPSIYFP